MNEGFGQIPMDEDRLKKYGANQARGLQLQGLVSPRGLARQLEGELRQLEDIRRSLEDGLGGEATLSSGGEWLLDNGYLAEREGRWACDALGQRGRIRRCGEGTVLMACAHGAVFALPQLDRHRLGCYLDGFQSVTPLTEGELCLLVPALVCALVEQLGTLTEGDRGLDSPQLGHQLGLIFGGLRAVGVTEWGSFLEGQSQVDAILRRDPAGIYGQMEEGTRHHYRHTLCNQARAKGMGEVDYAHQILAQAGTGHVGTVLFFKEDRGWGGLYGGAILVLTLILTATAGWMLKSWLVTLLLAFPISDLVKNVVDFLATRLAHPRLICRMELEEGIPQEGRTLCVIAALVTGTGYGLTDQLEGYYLANRDCGNQLRLGILADLPDSQSPMGEEQWKKIRVIQQEIMKLNQKYKNCFYLFFRPPVLQNQDKIYQGWERKRGALLELNRLILNKKTNLFVLAGENSWLCDVKYVITLDSDTALTVGSARELVGGMLHPLNRPILDERRRVVVGGYGLLQPRVSVSLRSANRTLFSRIFGGQGGIDPYGSTASEVYHDLFDSASYTGKGIYDIQMFDACLDGRFPDNTILSHDLLEGSYLRCGLLSQVELTDGVPAGVDGYFARQNRWVRGDWQLLPWLGNTVPAGGGRREKNPLSPLDRWKIADNLRRSLSPLFTLIPLILGVCFSDLVFALAGGVAVLAAASNLLLSGVELTARRGTSTHVRYHSTVIFGLAGAILQTLLQLILLPYQAYVSTRGALTALYRSCISKKKRLEWVTAAQTEGKKGGIFYYYRRQWCAVLVGLLTAVGADVRFGGLVGLVWMASPALSWYWSRPTGQKKSLSQGERRDLLTDATHIWGYFQQFLTEEHHHLPPDNWQEQPSVGVAQRTSPTNIGMALLSILSAVDLKIIPQSQGEEKIKNMLEVLEKLEKWQGHLYNWYDTATLSPLPPRYVSTVDSGNLCGCLIALSQGLRGWNREDLAERTEILAENMRFAPLYDREKKLFSIGWEEERGRLTQGWYDLMASEARQASFIAVARGEVEPRHWRRLGRMLVGQNDYRGMASWTGTMFEYFMPNLLLPWEENSLMYESLCFCIYAQRRRGRQIGTPWGISESGYYAFDSAMNYQYCAHGVQALGLKRGLDDQQVIAPYATYLALMLAPHSGLANLNRLRKMGAEGCFGLYEAVDYTPSRLEGEEKFQLVRSYMSHHLGMSLIAINNVLNNNVMQRRFMSDGQMSAFRELLQERVPMGAPVRRHREVEGDDLPPRRPPTHHHRSGEGASRRHPSCHLLSSGGYSLLCCDNGLTQAKLGECKLLRDDFGEFYTPSGISAIFISEKQSFGLTAAPLYQEDVDYSWAFYGGGAIWQASQGNLTAQTNLTVPAGENGELRIFTLNWNGEEKLEGELLIYLEPMLSKEQDYRAHPVFSKLFLESTQVENGVVFRRRPRGGERHPQLAILWEGEQVTYTTARELALGRGGLRAILSRKSSPLGNEGGEQTDPCLMVRIPVSLNSGEVQSVRLALSASDHMTSALEGAKRILWGGGGENRRLTALAHRLKLDDGDIDESFHLLSQLVAHQPTGDLSQSALWQFGISGDLPIALATVTDSQEGLRHCAQHQLLAHCGYHFDLVLLVDEGGDYRQPVATALREGLSQPQRLGTKGGIHILASGGEILHQWGCVALPLEEKNHRPDQLPPPPVSIQQGDVQWHYNDKNQVVIQTGEKLPPLGWSQILCNPNFGWMTDETGVGYLWAENAREGRLTPWDNDPLAVGGGERITLTIQNRDYAIFADGDGLPCQITYGFGTARWDKMIGGEHLVTEAFVPVDTSRKILVITWSGGLAILRHRQGDDSPLEIEIKRNQKIILETKAGQNTVSTRQITENIPEITATENWWRRRVCAIQVETPDRELNAYLNGWALYQVLACRVFGRTSQYQNGGAYGFRDQLQDVCALLYTHPTQAREQILLAASRQFEEGDVQHWWHPPLGAGVRTRITDDLLWLPYALSRYLEVTGDWDILDQQIPYLTAPPLKQGEQERYDIPEISCKVESLYQHAISAIECFLDRGLGDHGLPLMGAGDWNDGMNRVGARGRGESLWLGWFGGLTLQKFIPICQHSNDQHRASLYEQWAERLVEGGEQGWDGDWYRRGYFDDGTPLGSRHSHQCQIDSLAQSFAVFVQGSDRARARQGIQSAVDALYDGENQLIRLFTPAFTQKGKDAGYIRGYLPGVRENGGQYTHGAVWLARACLMLGDGDGGYQLLKTLLPATHPQQIYRAEPYVLAADVYATQHHPGRAGWSWYTGAAGWYYRTALENLLGIQLKNNILMIQPNLPAGWQNYQINWSVSDKISLKIEIKRGKTSKILLDGQPSPQGVNLSQLTGSHRLEIEILPEEKKL